MMKLKDLIAPAMAQLKANPNVAGNPMAQGMLDVIETGDAARGETMAKNLCESMGMTQEEALKQAKAFFGVR